MPGAGPLHHVVPPEDEEFIRVETGIRQGDEVSVHYDPMIAKLVVWGEDRNTALTRLISALQRYQIVGLNTNISFLLSLAKHPEFQLGNVHTEFIPQHNDSLFPKRDVSYDDICLAVLSLLAHRQATSPNIGGVFTSLSSNRLNHDKQENINFTHREKDISVSVTTHSDGSYTISDGTQSKTVSGSVLTNSETNRQTCTLHYDQRTTKCDSVVLGESVYLFTEHGLVELSLPLPKYRLAEAGSGSAADAVAPMPGVVDKVYVKPGDAVEEGQPMLVMIAMKMEYTIRAPRAGIVEKVPFSEGTTVQKGARLVHLQEESNPENEDSK